MQMSLLQNTPHKPVVMGSRITLRSTQPLAIDEVRKRLKDGKNRVIICAPCGFGKSVVAAKYIELARAKGSKVWFIVDRQNLVNQMSAHLDSFGIPHGVMMAKHARWDPLDKVQVASIQTVERRGWQDDIDFLLVDECFAAGTLVDGRPIETIKIGDYVTSWNESKQRTEQKRVTHVFKNFTRETVRLDIENTRSITCTPNHPFYNGDAYVSAGSLKKGSTVFRLTDSGLINRTPSIITQIFICLLNLWHMVCTRHDVSSSCISGETGRSMQESGMHIYTQKNSKHKQQHVDEKLFECRSQIGNDRQQPHEIGNYQRKDEKQYEDQKYTTKTAGRQWSWANITATKIIHRIRRWLAYGACCTNKAGTGMPEPLQNRYCSSRFNDSDRSRWNEPLRTGETRARQEKGQSIVPVRVGSVEVQKCNNTNRHAWHDGSNQGISVYNLEVEGNNNYFAEGILVHNCHALMRKSFIDFANKYPDKRIISFTATPFHARIGEIYEDVVSPTTVNKQIEEGHLVPLRIFQCIEADMRGAKIVAGEWSDDDVQERGSKIVGDIVSTWIKMTMQLFGQPVKTIVFSSTIAHGQEIADQFAAAGYNFKVVSCRDKTEEKTDTIADFKLSESEYDGLISCGVLTRGFDVTDIQIAIMARPFRKAFSEFIQQVGRVQRSHTWPDGTKKEFGVLLDHASNVARFRDEMLDLFENGVTSLADPPDAKPPRKEPTKQEKDKMFCPKCKILWQGGDTCSCGYKIKKKVSLIESVPGQLVEMDMTGRKANKTTSKADKQQFYSELIGYGQSKGFAPGWSAHQYREKFGVWPNSMLPVPAQPTALVTGYLHHQRIKKAKAAAR